MKFKSNFGIYCLKTDNVGSPLTDFVKNTATKEPKTEQGRSRRQLFHPFGDSSVRHDKQRGSASKFPHTPFQSSDIKLKLDRITPYHFPCFVYDQLCRIQCFYSVFIFAGQVFYRSYVLRYTRLRSFTVKCQFNPLTP